MLSIFRKKRSGTLEAKLGPEQFCSVIDVKAEDSTHKLNVLADGNHYNLLYRDGRFLGMPCPYGGAIYPFSKDPTVLGTKGQKKQYHSAKVVTLSKDFNLQVLWGTRTPFLFEDSNTGAAYEIRANGVFYVSIDPSDAARKADQFYSRCLTQRNAELFDTAALRDFLAAAFMMQIGAKIQEHMEQGGRSLSSFVGLQPRDILKISEELCPQMKDIFAEFGLTIVTAASRNSILQQLSVNPVVRA